MTQPTGKVRQQPQIRDVPGRAQDSIMVADCGSTTTKIVLLDLVEGQYRFVASAQGPSTVADPWFDISIGVIDAVRQMQETTGRTFLDTNNQLVVPERADGSGIDYFLAVSSAAKPLETMLVGLVHDVSLASARRAVLSTYASLKGTISLEQGLDQAPANALDDGINSIWRTSPDVLCIAGGTDGGAARPVMEMVQNVVRVALYLMAEHAPTVIYAGNADLRGAIAQQLGELAPLRSVDNVRPRAEVENLGPAHEELEVLFYQQKVLDIPGIRALGAWSPSIILPTARATDYAIRYCERAWKSSKPALGIDVGGSSVTINVSQDGLPLTTIRTDLGMGRGILGLLDQIQIADLQRWLPLEMSESEVRNRLLNKAQRPQSIPQTREDLLLEQAVARESVRLTLSDSLPGWPGQLEKRLSFPMHIAMERTGRAEGIVRRADAGGQDGGKNLMIPPCEPIIASGGVFTRAPYHGHAALILLDALQPTGISTLYLDEFNLLPALGAIANVNPLATVQALHNGGLTYMGTVVVPLGHGRPGERALSIRPVDKQSSIRLDITYGELEIVPLQLFEVGTMLELMPAYGLDIGRGYGRSLRIQYRGGSVGLIIDARGRPLAFDDDPDVQRQHMDRWLWEMMSA